MQNEQNTPPINGEPQMQSLAPWFAGRLTRELLVSFPQHFFLVSSIAHNPFNPAMELEVTAEISREALWRMIVDWRLNGRTFAVFLDEEAFQAYKDERLKAAWSLLRVP